MKPFTPHIMLFLFTSLASCPTMTMMMVNGDNPPSNNNNDLSSLHTNSSSARAIVDGWLEALLEAARREEEEYDPKEEVVVEEEEVEEASLRGSPALPPSSLLTRRVLKGKPAEEEGDGSLNENGNTRRLCVRALQQAHEANFEFRLPESVREVNVPCMSCAPTRPVFYCHSACQDYVNKVYNFCDGICLPHNYYFTKDQSLMGCWSDVVDAMKIEVEKCGCSSAMRGAAEASGWAAVLLAVVAGVVLLA
jgi:hypothetical protein